MKQKVLIVGAGEGGSALLNLLQSSNIFQIIGIIDINPLAKGLQIAKEYGITIGESVTPFLSMHIDVIFDMTGEDDVHKVLLEKEKDTLLIPGDIAKIVTGLAHEKEGLIGRLEEQTQQGELILNSTHDGMIVIDREGQVRLFNKSAERIIGYKKKRR